MSDMRTALYDRHCSLGAKMVSFGGWDMPIQYKGIISEHHCVRKAVGLFDVSHMGRIDVKGVGAGSFLDYLSTNKLIHKSIGTATYTVWCRENGSAVDDVIVFKEAEDSFFVIVNASNRQKDLSHMLSHTKVFDVTIQDRFENYGILALQGLLADDLMEVVAPDLPSMKFMHFTHYQNVLISRTGYTGSGGYEIYGSNKDIVDWWDKLLDIGRQFGIEPIGLGARDTLRLEAGYALYGHELSDSIAATESVSKWAVKLNKENFLGKESLEKLEESSSKRFELGIMLLDRGIAREGYSLFWKGNEIGLVTSGTFSPTLGKAIAIVLVNLKLDEGETVEVEIRGQRCQAQVVKIPFIKE